MLTPRRTHELMKRIHYHLYHLQEALNAAHAEEVIEYSDYDSEGPCASMDELRERIRLTTQNSCFNAIWDETRPKRKR